jgi:hypothetical protein
VDLIDIVENGPVIVSDDLVFLDNGSKVVVLNEMVDRMLGLGAYSGVPAGVDRYPEVPGIDSWVVRLPVVECQNPGPLCAGVTSSQITRALCFEIREIGVTPERYIAGRFFCRGPDPDLSAACDLGPPVDD